MRIYAAQVHPYVICIFVFSSWNLSKFSSICHILQSSVKKHFQIDDDDTVCWFNSQSIFKILLIIKEL